MMLDRQYAVWSKNSAVRLIFENLGVNDAMVGLISADRSRASSSGRLIMPPIGREFRNLRSSDRGA